MKNNPLLLQELHLEPFGKDALYRDLRIIAENRHPLLYHLLFTLKNEFDVGLDMVFMDWTRTHFEAQTTDFIKYGYSPHHRPERPQVTIGITQNQRLQIPVEITIQPGKMNDQTH